MAGSATVELAAAVAEAGGLGSLGSATSSPEALFDHATQFRSLTDRPLNLNFFCHQTPSSSELETVRALERLRPLYDELELEAPPEAAVPPIAFPAQLSISSPLSAAAAERGSSNFLAMWAGQATPLAREIPAGELVNAIVAEANSTLGG